MGLPFYTAEPRGRPWGLEGWVAVKVYAEVLGGYPRSERVRKLLRRLEEKGEAGYVEALRAVWEDTLFILGAQAGAGLDTLTDPVVEWHDPLRPFVEAWRNVAVDGLLRWFDNNFFYRIPVFVDAPDPKRYVVAPRVAQLRQALPGFTRIKVVLPGPVTFTRLSRNKSGKSDEELAEDIAGILAREARRAAEEGAAAVQLDEPWLADVDATPDDAALAAELASKILGEAKAAGAETRLAVQYNVPEPGVYEKLLDAKNTDYIVIDVADAPEKALRLLEAKGGPSGLGLGVVQARNIYPEHYGQVKPLIEKAVEAAKPERLLLTTSAWLDLIPLSYAIQKTNILGHIASHARKDLEQK